MSAYNMNKEPQVNRSTQEATILLRKIHEWYNNGGESLSELVSLMEQADEYVKKYISQSN